MVTVEWCPVLNPWGLFCYSFLSQPLLKIVSERLAGWAPGSQSRSTSHKFDKAHLAVSSKAGAGEHERHTRYGELTCVYTYSPVFLVTFHTVSADKIQQYLKPQGRWQGQPLIQALSLGQPVSHNNPTHSPCMENDRRLLQNYTKENCRQLPLLYLPLRKGMNSHIVPYSPLLWQNQRNAINSCQESIVISPEIRLRCY